MTCQRDGCAQPVKRFRARGALKAQYAPVFGPDSPWRYRRYCSRACCYRDALDGQSLEQRRENAAQTIVRGNRRRRDQQQAAIARVREALGADWTSGQPITAQQAVKLYRLAYDRGWRTAYRKRILDARKQEAA